MNVYRIYKNRINENKIKYRFMKPDNSNLTYAEFLNLLTSRDNDFLRMFRGELNRASSELIEPDIASYLWECVPVSRATINKPFEFVVVNSPELKRKKQNLSPFQEHFNRSGGSDVVSFTSLSGDAVLVSPVPVIGYQYSCDDRDNEMRNYKDMEGFNNDAPQCQFNSLWQKIGEEMKRSLNNSGGATRWLNTHGLVVNYFHVRIDSRPKYYEHQEYLREDASQNRHEQPQISNVKLVALKEQAISEITNELAKSPEFSILKLEPEYRQWKSEIEKKTSEEAIEGYKNGVLFNIGEIREVQTEKPIKDYSFQDNYDGWTREQFIVEINRLKAENERLKNDKTITNTERQNLLQQNQWKLDKLEKNISTVASADNSNSKNNNFPTGWVVSGGILAIVGLTTFLIIKKSKKGRIKKA